jgi:hypothetical protein
LRSAHGSAIHDCPCYQASEEDEASGPRPTCHVPPLGGKKPTNLSSLLLSEP